MSYGTLAQHLHEMRRNSPQPNKIIGVFVELAQPFSNGNGLYNHMPPHLIRPAVANALFVGWAQGITFFPQDHFNDGVDYQPLSNRNTYNGLLAATQFVNRYAAALNTPILSDTSATTNGPVSVGTRSHNFQGYKYIFAMGHGNTMNYMGAAVDATITISGFGDGVADVLDENRTVQIRGGRFEDHFDPYEWHIYRIPLGSSLTGGGGESSGSVNKLTKKLDAVAKEAKELKK